MRRLACVGLLLLPLWLAAGDGRVQCCHGCGSYYCSRDNCGQRCGMGPQCRGCWTNCERRSGA